MAEATGLVLGGVALVGLVSTCVEILEYLESAKNRAGDFGVALVKVNLIKQRLSDWGADVNTCFFPSPQHASASSDCRTLMEETLARIRTLLDQTNRMSRRHSVHDQHQRDINSPRRPAMRLPFWSKSVDSDINVAVDGGESFKSPPSRRPQPLLSFSLRVLWVFLDKKRFDNVIEQLDFLLSNLEKITETLHGRVEMAHSNGSGQRPAYSNWKTELFEDSDHQSTDEDNMIMDSDDEHKAISTGGHLVTSLCQPSRGPIQYHPSYNQPGSSEVSTSARPAQGQSGVHRFEHNVAYGYSAHLLGDMGIRPESSHKGHDFLYNESHGESTMLSGSMDMTEVRKLLKEARADRRRERADERNQAPAAPRSTGGITKRARR